MVNIQLIKMINRTFACNSNTKDGTTFWLPRMFGISYVYQVPNKLQHKVPLQNSLD